MVGLVRDEKCMQLQVWATCFACHTSNTSTAHDCRMDCSRGFYYILLVASHFILSLGFKKKFHCDKVSKMHAIANLATCLACHTSNTYFTHALTYKVCSHCAVVWQLHAALSNKPRLR